MATSVLVIAGIVTVSASILAFIWLSKPASYFTWFLLHYAVGVYGISAVIILALVDDLSSAAAAILSSIVAYTLGASSRNNSSSG